MMAVVCSSPWTVYGKMVDAPKSAFVNFGRIAGQMYVQPSQYYHFPVVESLTLRLPACAAYFDLIPAARRTGDVIQIGMEGETRRLLFAGLVDREPEPIFLPDRTTEFEILLRLSDVVSLFKRKGKRWYAESITRKA